MTDYDLTKPVQQKIKQRMDQLQEWMEGNHHLHHPDDVLDLIESVSKFWSALQEEDRDYIHGAKHALEEKMEWKI